MVDTWRLTRVLLLIAVLVVLFLAMMMMVLLNCFPGAFYCTGVNRSIFGLMLATRGMKALLRGVPAGGIVHGTDDFLDQSSAFVRDTTLVLYCMSCMLSYVLVLYVLFVLYVLYMLVCLLDTSIFLPLCLGAFVSGCLCAWVPFVSGCRCALAVGMTPQSAVCDVMAGTDACVIPGQSKEGNPSYQESARGH